MSLFAPSKKSDRAFESEVSPAPSASLAGETAWTSFVDGLIAGNYDQSLNGGGPLVRSLNKLAVHLRQQALQEMDRAVQISIQSNDVSVQSIRMLSELRRVDGKAHGIAAAAEELVASVQEIGRNGQNIASMAIASSDATCEGARAVQDARDRMEDISGVVKENVKRVKTLSGFTREITSIADTIKKIAGQTNLLALNATIEAARAGSAGKGFAVVAGEVKNLSAQTTQATQQIESLVKNLQNEMKAIAGSMNESQEAVKKGQASIEEVGASMEGIKLRSEQVRHSTGEITGILTQQATASEEVAKGILEISGNAAKNASGIDSVVRTAAEIEKSISGCITALGGLDVPGKVVKLAKSDHVAWKKRLINMAAGLEKIDPDDLSNHHQCRLGKWYDACRDPHYVEHPAFRAMARPHEEVHAHGRRAAQLYKEGNLDGVLESIDAVEKASKEVLQKLGELDLQDTRKPFG